MIPILLASIIVCAGFPSHLADASHAQNSVPKVQWWGFMRDCASFDIYGLTSDHCNRDSTLRLQKWALRIAFAFALATDEPMDRRVARFTKEIGIHKPRILSNANKKGRINPPNDSRETPTFTTPQISQVRFTAITLEGIHRIGCLVACLRKTQKWPIDEILQRIRNLSR